MRRPLFVALGSLVMFGDVSAQDAIEWDGIRLPVQALTQNSLTRVRIDLEHQDP